MRQYKLCIQNGNNNNNNIIIIIIILIKGKKIKTGEGETACREGVFLFLLFFSLLLSQIYKNRTSGFRRD